MLENQKKHKKEGTNKGLFESPIKKMSEQAGRPGGSSGIKQETKKVSPLGPPNDSKASEEESYSLSALKDNMISAQKLQQEVEKSLKKTHNKKRLTKTQKEVAGQIAEIIIINEDPKEWLSSIEDYCKNPVDKNKERVEEVREFAEKHDLDFYLSSLLLASKKEN